MNTMEELQKELKRQKRKNLLLEQALKQDNQIRQKYSEALILLEKKEIELIELNSSLEEKVRQRTNDIENMLQREQHFKQIMRMVADVNEFLVGAMNVQSIIKNSIDNICKHENYKFCWFGMINSDNSLDVIYKSQDIYKLIDKKSLQLDTNEDFIYHDAIEAIKTGTSIFTDALQEKFPHMQKRRADDYLLKSSVAIPLFYDDSKSAFGVYCVYLDTESMDAEEISILENLGKDIAFAISINRHRNVLEKLELEKITNYEETILAFVDIIEQRDAYTAGHTIRVAQYCRLIATGLNISQKEIQKLEQAAILHDIGKVVTPDSILLKPGKLSALEYDLIKQHAVSGYQMLSKIAMYKDLAQIIKHHHEHYDGSGYPDGLKGDEITLLTHILIVADAFDAMTTNRIYKGRKTVQEAVTELDSLSGICFHPKVIEVAVNVLNDVDIEDADQLPHSDLEQKRFSYFFQDALTSVHNESYLELVLNRDVHEHKCLHLLLLRDFSKYNKTYGWDNGNELLKEISNYLLEEYPQSELFRFHGDDFVILSKEHLIFDLEKANKFLEKYEVYFETKHFEMEQFSDVKEIIAVLE